MFLNIGNFTKEVIYLKIILSTLIIIFVLALLFPAHADELDDFYNQYLLIRSNWHCHTSNSRNAWSEMKKPLDADHLPAESAQKTLQRAREMDLVLILTDHNIKLYPWQWKAQGDLIMQLALEDQLCLRGFEWTPWDYNHINIINSRDYVTADNRQIEAVENCSDIGKLLDWLDKQPQDVIAQLNHPLYYNKLFDYSAIANHPASRFFHAIEIGSGPPIHYQWTEEECQRAWQCGLKVGLTLGIDNFGRITENARHQHTAVWLDQQQSDRQSLITAMQARRFFASEDEDIEVLYALKVEKADERIEYYPMGSEVLLEEDDCLTYLINAYDNTDNNWTYELINVFTDRTIILAKTEEKLARKTVLDYPMSYGDYLNSICVYLKITQEDGERAVASPIWIKISPDPLIYEQSPPPPPISQQEISQLQKEAIDAYANDQQKNHHIQQIEAVESFAHIDPLYYYPLNIPVEKFYRSQDSHIFIFTKLYGLNEDDLANIYFDFDFIAKNGFFHHKEIYKKFIPMVRKNGHYQYFYFIAETKNLPSGKYIMKVIHKINGTMVETEKAFFYLYDQ